MVYWIPTIAVTDYHKLRSLKQQILILSQSWRSAVKMQVLGGPCSLCKLGGKIHPDLLQLLVAPSAHWLWLLHSNLCPCDHLPSSCVSVCPLLSLINTVLLELGLIWSHLYPYLNYNLQRRYFQIRSHSGVFFGGGGHEFLRHAALLTTYGNISHEKPGMATWISGSIEFIIRRFAESKKHYFIMTKGSMH